MGAFQIKEKEIGLHHRGRCSGLLYLQNAKMQPKTLGGGTSNLVEFDVPAFSVFGCILQIKHHYTVLFISYFH